MRERKLGGVGRRDRRGVVEKEEIKRWRGEAGGRERGSKEGRKRRKGGME